MKKSLFKQPLFYTTVLSLSLLGLIIGSYVFGLYNYPTQAPPGGNITLSSGALPSGSAGYVQFANSSTAFGGDANLFWDNTNKRLGIGTTTPAYALDVNSALRLQPSGVPSVAKGTIYYDQSTDTFKGYQGSGWVNIYTGSQTGYMISTYVGALSATAAKSAAATILISPVFIPFTINVNSFLAYVGGVLGATGDIGLYNSNGTLLLNGGSGTLTTATGLKSVAPVQTGSARLIPPGQYYVAITWNSTTGQINGASIGVVGFIPRTGTIATGGGSVLPSSITLSNITAGTYLYAVTLSGSDQKENGAICSVAGDCLSGICYIDNDADLYYGSSGTALCRASATLGLDCYDSNANARPGQTTYFTTNRGDSSFDYNCDTIATKQWTCTPVNLVAGSCSRLMAGTAGYTASIPACGTSATAIRPGLYAGADSTCSGTRYGEWPMCVSQSCDDDWYGNYCGGPSQQVTQPCR